MSLESRPYLLHALSPLHVGTGQSVGLIDLPIARLRATNIPFVPGSSLKGVLREAHRGRLPPAEWEALFGPQRKTSGAAGDEPQDGDHAGALVVGDARLVALPVRSFRGTYALVTSPMSLHLTRRDFAGLKGLPERIPQPPGPGARVGPGSITLTRQDRLLLEDLDLDAQKDPLVEEWARFLAWAWPEEAEAWRQRLTVVDDGTMDFLLETGTQVDTRVRIDAQTGTVAAGQLWQEESLPAESLLVGVLAAGRSLRKGVELSAAEVLTRALAGMELLQLGGKATVGRGRCRLAAWPVASREARR